MEIVTKLQTLTATIQKTWENGGKQIAADMQALAIVAMEEGLKTPQEGQPSAWVDYVSKITQDKDEIKRLTGRDEVYMSRENAKGVLFYIVANGNCTEFSFADTTRYLRGSELGNLDK